ncbi:TonB-dependent receptor [Flavobacterium frigoris]|uniref:Outer membrane receptor proteins, mostly Fe transport n=1 Tax=Flavobacterium frigoris TaxID=229204 RepID=A0A1H9PI69_FLAFI|nr:TonB-dependent receptor [Flavobacterium frigoris]SER47921.1 Outer membrane receptor proteins, mostly Fe transport [Flavobacterium frigoris]
MQFKIFITVLTSICGMLIASAQNTGTLKGTIKTEQGEPIIGSNVIIKNTNKGTTTDSDGTYEIKLLEGKTYSIEVSYLGYNTIQKNIFIKSNTTILDFILNESSNMLEGIIVTSQKREQKNKEVPIAITSYGSEFINNQGTFEYDALSEYVPGFQVQIQSVNNPGVVIRGITSDSGDSRVEPRVSIFQDGVSISKSRGSVVELYDIERVEVLKGPQGTLFGRGAQIGAMHIIQNKAKNENSGSVKLGYGNFNQFLATGYANTPLIADKLFLRVAGIYNRRDGYIENRSGGNLNGKETLAFRTALKYLISDRTTLDVIANWQQDTPPGTSFKSGTFAPLGGDLDPNTFADLERGRELGVNRNVSGATGILKHNFNPVWDLTSTTAYRQFNSDEAFDADGTAAPALFFREIAKGKQFSQELRFNFDNSKKFRGFFGGNFFYENGTQKVPFIIDERSLAVLFLDTPKLVINGIPTLLPTIPNDPDSFGPLAGAPLLDSNSETFTNYGKNYSGDLFADGSYDLTEKLSLTLGLRTTWENINAGFEVDDIEKKSNLALLTPGSGTNILNLPTNGKIQASENFLSAVGRLALSYNINQNISLFGTTSKGRRPNVINISSTNTNVLSAETVWSYEVGAKSLFLNNRLQFDANAYVYDYSNFQTTISKFENGVLTSRPEDSGSASSFGYELATQYAFTKNSSFFANYGYIDASFDETDSNGNKQALAGNKFRLTPKHSFSAGFNLNQKINNSLKLFFRPTYTYKSKVFFEETNLPKISQDGYGIVNLRTGLNIGKKYEITLFMNNLLDKKYIIDAGNTGGAFGIPTFIGGAPRFYGVQLRADF